MAHPCCLRLRARARTLARLRTHLFSQFGNPLLVANHPTVAIACASFWVVNAALSSLCRYRQHRALWVSRLLRPSRLQLLPEATKPVPDISHDRSDCRRRHHVGYRLTGLSGARHLDRGKSSPTPEAFPILVGCTPMLGTDPRGRRLDGCGRSTFTTHHFEA